MIQVTRIRLRLSNAYLIQSKRAILVDSGSPGEGKVILRALARAGVAADSLSLLLHTHGHVDHAGAAADLQRLSGAPVAIHVADAPLLRSGRNGPVPPTRLEARLVKPFVDKPFPAVTPDLLIEQPLDLSPFGVEGRVVMTPGHTPGSISVLLASGEAIVGDVLMGGILGGAFQAGQPNLHYFVRDAGQLRQSLDFLLAEPVETLYVGHGGPLAAETVRARSGSLFAQLGKL